MSASTSSSSTTTSPPVQSCIEPEIIHRKAGSPYKGLPAFSVLWLCRLLCIMAIICAVVDILLALLYNNYNWHYGGIT